MEIGKRQKSRWVQASGLLGVLVVMFGLGLLVGEANGWQTAVQRWQGVRLSGGSPLPVLSIDMPFENYSSLLAQRDEGAASGVFIGDESDFLNADIQLDGETVPVRLRLQQGINANLGDDDKWHFDVRTRQEAELRGMRRFSLIDPAVNQWLAEWLFVQAARQEGLLAGRYEFVQLRFNGEDRGIYALQEQPSDSLLAANGRSAGVIVQFDAEPIWQTVRQFGGDAASAADNPIRDVSASAYQFLPIDTLQERSVAADVALTAQQAQATNLLQQLQSDTLPGATIFDAAQYGRFLALVDLFGAKGATTMTNLSFYYAPESQTFQPILQNGHAVSGRISPADSYFDPALQIAYLNALADYSDPAFLAELEAVLGAEFARLQQAVSSDVTPQPVWERLAARQLLLRQSLDPVQPVLAYFEPSRIQATESLTLLIANPLNVPLVLDGIDVGAATFLAAERAWVVDGESLLLPEASGVTLAAQAGETAVVRYVRLAIPIAALQAADVELQGDRPLPLWVATRLPGSDVVRLTAVDAGAPQLFRIESE